MLNRQTGSPSDDRSALTALILSTAESSGLYRPPVLP